MRHPYTEALFRSIPKIEYPSHTKLATIPGRPPDMINPPRGCKFADRCRYARPECFEEEPPLVQGVDPSHEFRCFFPVGTPAAEQALQANIAEGRVNEDGELIGIS
jgi:peptide/nickel transport system ATP-binding protein